MDENEILQQKYKQIDKAVTLLEYLADDLYYEVEFPSKLIGKVEEIIKTLTYEEDI